KKDYAMAQQNKPAASKPKQDLPLFYKNPVVIDKNVHGTTGVVPLRDYGFARNVNAVPIALVELPQVVSTYPVVFTAGNLAMPVALLGLHEGENLFVDEKGNWQKDTYIPAYIRRYPFIFAEHGDTLTLCIDDQPGILSAKDGEKMFDDNKDMTPFTTNALEFCKSYHTASQETAQFAAILQDADLLVERHATIRVEGQQPYQLSGFRQLDEEKFRNLSADQLADWHKKGWLGALYAHILSVSNWQKLFTLAHQSKK
ncbi:MAG TPA: SapC family protein, partial [Alphaproteobacteria bacterium]